MFKVNIKRYQNDAIDVVLVSLLLTQNILTPFLGIPIVGFEQVNAYWVLVSTKLIQIFLYHTDWFQLKTKTAKMVGSNRTSLETKQIDWACPTF